MGWRPGRDTSYVPLSFLFFLSVLHLLTVATCWGCATHVGDKPDASAEGVVGYAGR